MATGGDRVSAGPPIVGFDFINDDDSRPGILAKDMDEQIGNATDKRGLLSARCAIASDLDVDVRHAGSCGRNVVYTNIWHKKSTSGKHDLRRPQIGDQCLDGSLTEPAQHFAVEGVAGSVKLFP